MLNVSFWPLAVWQLRLGGWQATGCWRRGLGRSVAQLGTLQRATRWLARLTPQPRLLTGAWCGDSLAALTQPEVTVVAQIAASDGPLPLTPRLSAHLLERHLGTVAMPAVRDRPGAIAPLPAADPASPHSRPGASHREAATARLKTAQHQPQRVPTAQLRRWAGTWTAPTPAPPRSPEWLAIPRRVKAPLPPPANDRQEAQHTWQQQLLQQTQNRLQPPSAPAPGAATPVPSVPPMAQTEPRLPSTLGPLRQQWHSPVAGLTLPLLWLRHYGTSPASALIREPVREPIAGHAPQASSNRRSPAPRSPAQVVPALAPQPTPLKRRLEAAQKPRAVDFSALSNHRQPAMPTLPAQTLPAVKPSPPTTGTQAPASTLPSPMAVFPKQADRAFLSALAPAATTAIAPPWSQLKPAMTQEPTADSRQPASPATPTAYIQHPSPSAHRRSINLSPAPTHASRWQNFPLQRAQQQLSEQLAHWPPPAAPLPTQPLNGAPTPRPPAAAEFDLPATAAGQWQSVHPPAAALAHAPPPIAPPATAATLPALCPPQQTYEPVKPVASITARQGAQQEGGSTTQHELDQLAANIKRILDEEARRYGIDV